MIKLCECGCKQPTKIITHTNNKLGRIKGEYSRFVNGHHYPTETQFKKGHKGSCGKNNGMYGKHVSETAKAKLRKINVGKNNPMYGVQIFGKDNPNWRGGKSFEPYPITFNNQLKDKIRARDNFICQKCGVPELECNERLTCHHIDYNKENCSEDNLTSLCHKCNSEVNANREYWTEYFQKLVIPKLKIFKKPVRIL